MKLLIVRHGDPDYVLDSLTEKGKREAEFLAERLCKLEVKDFYVSPLGRAQRTAEPTLTALGRTAETLDWLREFDASVLKPNKTEHGIAWDWLPEDWTIRENFYDKDAWLLEPEMMDSDTKEKYDAVIAGFDALLCKHGYRRSGNIYKVENANNDTIVLFCHFGLEAVLMSHLLNVSPMVLWHGFAAAPTSVTTIVSEERREGKASFRISSFGDISHLYVHDEPPAFAARFSECYKNEGERLD